MLDWILATLLAVSVIFNLGWIRRKVHRNLCRKLVAAWQRIGDLEEFAQELQADRRHLRLRFENERVLRNQDLQKRKMALNK